MGPALPPAVAQLDVPSRSANHHNPVTIDLPSSKLPRFSDPSSKRPPREPYTEETLIAILNRLSRDDPLDVAIKACATTLFWGVARTGEFTVQNLTAFDPARTIVHTNKLRQRWARSVLPLTTSSYRSLESVMTQKSETPRPLP